MQSFWDRVDQSGGAEACWPWTGGRDKDGYGKHTIEGRGVRAHRVAIGLVPAGMCVLHRCDNPPCCNPAHLFLGTNRDNTDDRVRKGRTIGASPGEQHHNARLTRRDVTEIRALAEYGIAQNVIARRFGISEIHASRIIRGLRWRSVEC